MERAAAAGVELLAVYARAGVHFPEATSVSDAAMAKMSGRTHPPDVLAVARIWETTSLPPATAAGWWVALVGVEKPGNVGAMLRSASALGADGVLLVDSRVDVFSANVVRNSAGALFSVPVAFTSESGLRQFAAERSAQLIATVPEGGRRPWELDLTGSIVVCVGNEAAGLPPGLIEAADAALTVPMRASSVDSLNASVTTGIVLAEVVRQRSA